MESINQVSIAYVAGFLYKAYLICILPGLL